MASIAREVGPKSGRRQLHPAAGHRPRRCPDLEGQRTSLASYTLHVRGKGPPMIEERPRHSPDPNHAFGLV